MVRTFAVGADLDASLTYVLQMPSMTKFTEMLTAIRLPDPVGTMRQRLASGEIRFEARAADDVRHELKQSFREAILEHFAPSPPDANAIVPDPARARQGYRDAVDRFANLNGSDRGALWEGLLPRLDAIERGLDPRAAPQSHDSPRISQRVGTRV